MKKTPSEFLLEVCVDSAESAIAAQQGGAQRVELCDNLIEGGTTPGAGTIQVARKYLTIGLNVMIRPRGGDFCYSDLEFEIMCRDIEIAQQLGADGIVLGILKPNGVIDKKRTHALMDLARPMNVTFHRAFDVTRDPFAALDTLMELGIDRLLTSGQEASAIEGLDLIAELIRRGGNRIIIMPGGGINERNIARVLMAAHPREIHLTAFTLVDSPMQFRNPRVFMGAELRPPEYSRSVTDPQRVRRILRAAGGRGTPALQ
jgi:copper homeostasis protein